MKKILLIIIFSILITPLYAGPKDKVRDGFISKKNVHPVKNDFNINLFKGDPEKIFFDLIKKFKINGIIEKEPDRMFSFATFGPRVLLSTEALKDTGLIKAGSLIKYKTKFIPNNENKIDLAFLNDLVKGTNVSIRSIENTTNNFNNFVYFIPKFINICPLFY